MSSVLTDPWRLPTPCLLGLVSLCVPPLGVGCGAPAAGPLDAGGEADQASSPDAAAAPDLAPMPPTVFVNHLYAVEIATGVGLPAGQVIDAARGLHSEAHGTFARGSSHAAGREELEVRFASEQVSRSTSLNG